MQSLNNIINNPLVKTPMFKYIFLSVISVMILFIVYSSYQKLVKKQKNQPRLIPAKDVQSGKDYFHVLSNDLPSTTHGHGYCLSLWLWIDDFSYNTGKYRHIVHRGDFKMNSVQPGVWLHPTNNKLMIRFDNDNREVPYDYIGGKIFKSLNEDEGNHDKLHNVSLTDAKHKCSVSSSCLGFATVKHNRNTNHIENAYYPITQEDSDLVDPGPQYSTNHRYHHKEIGTYMKHTKESAEAARSSRGFNARRDIGSTSQLGRMNPNNPDIASDSNISSDIDNIPLNRWFHLIINVNNQTLEVYIDGRLRMTKNSSAHMKNNNGNMYFSVPDETGDDSGFGGYRTNCQYFNKPLTQTEISKMYYKGPSPFMLPDLHNYEAKIEKGMKSVSHLTDNINIGGQSFSPSQLSKYL